MQLSGESSGRANSPRVSSFFLFFFLFSFSLSNSADGRCSQRPAIVADAGDRDFYIPRMEMIFVPAGTNGE